MSAISVANRIPGTVKNSWDLLPTFVRKGNARFLWEVAKSFVPSHPLGSWPVDKNPAMERQSGTHRTSLATAQVSFVWLLRIPVIHSTDTDRGPTE